MMKHDSKGISEWNTGKKYGKHFPKDFFFSKEDFPPTESKDSRNNRQYYNREMHSISSKFKKSLMGKKIKDISKQFQCSFDFVPLKSTKNPL